MDNYLVINGNRINIDNDTLEELGVLLKRVFSKTDPFARAEYGEEYYCIGRVGNLYCDREDGTASDADCHRVANYCTDKAMMEQRALHETLNRLLWRYSEQHGGDNDWNGVCLHWRVCVSPLNGDFRIFSVIYTKELGAVYFPSEAIASAAIEEIIKPFMADNPQFVW